MRALMFIFRMVFGVTFILSGFFKVIDPVGTGLVVEEYLHIMHLDFLRFGSVLLGVILSVTELVVGIAVVMGVRMKVISWIALVMTLFFTVLTLVTAYFGLMMDCGCFGEAISLTPWQTVMKNVVLTLCIVPIFLYRNRFQIVAPTPAAWSFLATYAAIASGLALYSYLTLPLGDFGDFRAGSNVSEKYENVTDAGNYETKFAYSRGGETQLFDLDHLPDTSWTYVSSVTMYNGDERDLLFDMTLTDIKGDIVTDAIIHTALPVYVAVIHRPGKKSEAYWDRLMDAKEMVLRYGGIMYIAAPAPHKVLDSLQSHVPAFPQVLYADYKTLIAMARSNGAVMYLQDGMVVRKWNGRSFDAKTVIETMSEDAEEIMARSTIHRRLFYESAVLLMFLILIVFRYVCGIVYGKRYTMAAKEEKARRRLLKRNKNTQQTDPLYAEDRSEI